MTVTTLGSFAGANDKDKSSRIPAALSNLNRALNGDAGALAELKTQAASSATVVGKDANRRALAIYAQQMASSAAPGELAPVPHPTVTVANPVAIPPARPVMPYPGVVTTTEPKPIGFDYSHDPMVHPPIPVPGGIYVTGLPGSVFPVNVGAAVDGGAITGPPAPTDSGPVGTTPAPASFGYAAPGAPGSAPVGAPATVAAEPASNAKIFVLLAIGVALFLFVDAQRTNK